MKKWNFRFFLQQTMIFTSMNIINIGVFLGGAAIATSYVVAFSASYCGFTSILQNWPTPY